MSEATTETTDTTEKKIKRVKERVRKQNSESTADRYLRATDHLLEWLQERGINPFDAAPLDFEDYMNDLIADDYAYGTLKIRLQGPRAFYQAAEELRESQEQQRDRGREVRRPTIPEVFDPTEGFSLGDWNVDRRSKQARGLKANDDHHKLSQEEIDQLAEHAPSPRTRNALLIRLMHQCCLRRGEVARLTIDDVNDNDSPPTIDVPAVKGNKGRDAPIPYRHTLNDLMRLWIDVERKGVASAASSDYLFPTERAEHITEDQVSAIVRTAAERAPDVDQETLYVDNMGREKKKIHSHTLRASGAHRIWDETQDIYLVSKVLGHSDVDTTERYLDADPEEIITKAHEAL